MLDGITSRLEHYMDMLASRQKVVASNMANVDTPGYKTKDIDFQHEFRSLLKGDEPSTIEVDGLQSRNDGNNVSLDREARLRAENALRFSAAMNLVRSQVHAVRSAIKEGNS